MHLGSGVQANLWPWAHVLHFPFKAFSHKVEAKAGQSRTSFLMVLLEWKFSSRCSSASSDLGRATSDATASCKVCNFSSKRGWRIPSAPPVATYIHYQDKN